MATPVSTSRSTTYDVYPTPVTKGSPALHEDYVFKVRPASEPSWCSATR